MSGPIDLLFVQNHPPHGSINGQEVLDACLMGSAFASTALVFLGDGVFQIVPHQDTSSLGLKDYSVSYGVLKDYGVEKIFCLASDLEQRSLNADDLVIDVELIDEAALSSLVASSCQVMTF